MNAPGDRGAGVMAGATAGATAHHPAVRAVWAARLGSEAAADRFLDAAEGDMPDPAELPGLAAAADRIELALAAGESITVFGHDDPDGITSAVLLAEALAALGGDVDAYIPDRHVEGHGLYPALVDRLHERGVELLVTTDGCSGNADEVARAAGYGMDVVVTDHHELAAGRPRPPVLVNPRVDPGVAARLGDLTGAGVAALVAHELLGRAARPDRFGPLLDLVALGTLADWGDLGRSNRSMVVRGLADVAAGRRPAVAAAAAALDLDAGAILRPERARELAAVFASIPSRDGRSAGFDALAGRPGWEERTEELVGAWRESENEIRDTADRAEEQAQRNGIRRGDPAVILLEEGALRGLGRAATRLVEITGRPAAVLLRTGDDVVAELRGPEGVHLVEVLAGMRHRLKSWGGHRVAAGFSADAAQVEAIRRELAEALGREEPAAPAPAEAEAVVAPGDLGVAFVGSLRRAAPFGKGNPAPIVRVRRLAGLPAAASAEDGKALATALENTPGCAVLFAGRLPDGGAGRDPLVTFEPYGRAAMRPCFREWAPADDGGTP